ncbi:uncharacterized protein LOC6548940 [Drosophila erecta]|uniref:Uncharacterized protein n=1 Tax=Drosophila erecta TaxID=7220 RepID=B3NL40_DROER|nr:uncharacterized protein LOC6548940 [Drosophila erecta]EDV54618.2 uncharacterized protein Dere_GG21204 [Drosophila erecta]
MRCMLIFVISAVSLACAVPPQSENQILATFFSYVETIRGIQIHNMMVLTTNFVQGVVDSVPVEDRGPDTATLQAYANKGKSLRLRGTTGEKYMYSSELKQVFEGLKLSEWTPETEVPGMSLFGLLDLSDKFAYHDKKLHKQFVDAATLMKAKLTLATIARESELFNAIDEYIAAADASALREPLFLKVFSFKDRY